ncbi:hypothetical protein TSAR_003136 [Trichomalopsis sarcophagae]|uniref:Uncharacterized protein n=1 Tax=Trichomalopsis sarcophagae TaxID=543379 RepID=A0A232EMD8_9HYME|nr:hypothetical protein TSAR_003136 [Trichomalopsis sarcophagae]
MGLQILVFFGGHTAPRRHSRKKKLACSRESPKAPFLHSPHNTFRTRRISLHDLYTRSRVDFELMTCALARSCEGTIGFALHINARGFIRFVLVCRKKMSMCQGRSWHLVVGLTAAVALGGIYRRLRSRSSRLGPRHLIVLTGCDSGLGYSLACHCLCQGAKVVAGVLQEKSEAADRLVKSGATVLSLDLTDDTSVERFGREVEKISQTKDREFRTLVNNAGVMIFGEFEWQLADQVRSQLEVNVLGTMSLTKRLLPWIREGKSRIINVTSHCALAPLPGLAAYGASKAALQAWSSSLRVELRKYGVQVVMLIPVPDLRGELHGCFSLQGSFAKESNLLANQKKHFDDMRSGMSEEARTFYGDYFERYACYLESLSGPKKVCRLENPKVYEVFEAALLDDRPAAVYKCEPWRYTLYHTLFRIAPTRLRDWLVERFMQMPAWNRS